MFKKHILQKKKIKTITKLPWIFRKNLNCMLLVHSESKEIWPSDFFLVCKHITFYYCYYFENSSFEIFAFHFLPVRKKKTSGGDTMHFLCSVM